MVVLKLFRRTVVAITKSSPGYIQIDNVNHEEPESDPIYNRRIISSSKLGGLVFPVFFPIFLLYMILTASYIHRPLSHLSNDALLIIIQNQINNNLKSMIFEE